MVGRVIIKTGMLKARGVLAELNPFNSGMFGNVYARVPGALRFAENKLSLRRSRGKDKKQIQCIKCGDVK